MILSLSNPQLPFNRGHTQQGCLFHLVSLLEWIFVFPIHQEHFSPFAGGAVMVRAIQPLSVVRDAGFWVLHP